jgi:hypothetical protein
MTISVKPNLLKLDNPARVTLGAKSQRCLRERHTAAGDEIFIELVGDATANRKKTAKVASV